MCDNEGRLHRMGAIKMIKVLRDTGLPFRYEKITQKEILKQHYQPEENKENAHRQGSKRGASVAYRKSRLDSESSQNSKYRQYSSGPVIKRQRQNSPMLGPRKQPALTDYLHISENRDYYASLGFFRQNFSTHRNLIDIIKQRLFKQFIYFSYINRILEIFFRKEIL